MQGQSGPGHHVDSSGARRAGVVGGDMGTGAGGAGGQGEWTLQSQEPQGGGDQQAWSLPPPDPQASER